MYEKRLCEVAIPTITPMKEDGSTDDASLADFTWYLLEAGANALYPNKTNGESLLLTNAAHAVGIGADGIGIMSSTFFQMDEEVLFQYYHDVIKGLIQQPGPCAGRELS